MAIVEEAAVAVDRRVGSFGEDAGNAFKVQASSEGGTGRPLYAVPWPKDLVESSKLNHIAGLTPRMVGCEAAMIGGMQVLRRNDQAEVCLHSIPDGDDHVAIRNGERPTGQEVVLNVY
jgi:hypothetical protein